MNSSVTGRTLLRCKHAAELPASLRGICEEMEGNSPFAFLLFDSPLCAGAAKERPASVLGVNATEWIHAAEGEGGEVIRHDVFGTLFVEVQISDREGRLVVHFNRNGQIFAHGVDFAPAAEEAYCQAAALIAAAVPGYAELTGEALPEGVVSAVPMPSRFRTSLAKLVPPGDIGLVAVSWDAVVIGRDGWFKRELAPAGALVATRRLAVALSEEKIPSRLHRQLPEKKGYTATLYPRARLIGCEPEANDRLRILIGYAPLHASRVIEIPAGARRRAEQILRVAAASSDFPPP